MLWGHQEVKCIFQSYLGHDCIFSPDRFCCLVAAVKIVKTIPIFSLEFDVVSENLLISTQFQVQA